MSERDLVEVFDRDVCQDCRFWFTVLNMDIGNCRRYAPRAGEGQRWPQAARGDWCGEFSKNVADESGF